MPGRRPRLTHKHTVKGMLQLHELRKCATGGEIETIIVAFTDHYGRLIGKRFDAEVFVDQIAEEGAHGCDYLLTTDMEMEPVPVTPSRTGSWVTAISTSFRISRRCGSRAGSTRPLSCYAT
jgi:hypothetical protein